MIALMKRILSVSGPYQGRIKLAFVFAFLKAMLSKAPIGLSFLALGAFLQGTITARLCLWLAVGTVGCVLLECLCQNIADRLQAAAGYMVFADLRMELGRHLRRLPMGYFTEGNIGKISSVLSTDMVFIEENCMQLYLCPSHSCAVAGLPESLAGTGRLGGGRDHLAVGPRFPGKHPGSL